MNNLEIGIQLDRSTWFYLSVLVIVALYFRFNRIWSLRNLDLLLLLSPTPGLLLIEMGAWSGYIVLLASAGILLTRVLSDPFFKRRPRFPQNLNTPGLAFLAVACGVFHVTEIASTSQLPSETVQAADMAARMIERQESPALAPVGTEPPTGPTTAVLSVPAVVLSQLVSGGKVDDSLDVPMRLVAIFAHLGLASALLVLGWRGFADLPLGVAMATLYLLLPYTSYNVEQVNHVLPGALILWAAVCMRTPLISGALMGLACGTLFFPVFLIPIWISFYGLRNAGRFLVAMASVWLVLLGSIALITSDTSSFVARLVDLIDRAIFDFSGEGYSGIWEGVHGAWRMPVFVLFVIMVFVLCWWPRRRSMEHLITRLAAVIIAIQFWYPHEGGIYLLWYVPLLLAMIFRPVLSNWGPPDPVPWAWPHWRTGSADPPGPPRNPLSPVTGTPKSS